MKLIFKKKIHFFGGNIKLLNWLKIPAIAPEVKFNMVDDIPNVEFMILISSKNAKPEPL